jgi:glycosyltransferase involved in cell wall biosynthesis
VRIGVDARCLRGGPDRFTGVATATWNLLRGLLEEPGVEVVLYPGFHRRGVFDPSVLDGAALRVRWDRLPAPLHRWTAAAFPIDARRAGIDVFLGPDYLLPPLRGAPAVLVVNDLSFYRYPGSVSEPVLKLLRRDFPRSAARAARLVTPSEFSRREVLELLAPGEERVATIPWAPPPELGPAAGEEVEEFCRRRGLERGYLLAMGSLQPRKNLRRLLRAFHAWRQGRPAAPRLVLTGGTAWKSDELAAEIGTLPESVVRLGSVPAGDLRALYCAAGALAFPSLYEGFGLPIVEAMACGIPVLTSSWSACPEVAGDAALCVDPEDDRALEAGIERVLTDQDLRRRLIARGFERAGQFSFRETARRYREVLEAAAGERAGV